MANTETIKGYIQASFDPISQDIPNYYGSYEVIPTHEQQTLLTGGKALENDIIIQPSPYDSNTTDANAKASEILNGKTVYVNKNKITGSMPNNGAVNKKISSISEKYVIPKGYHNGQGEVSIDASQVNSENIKSGATILGVQGGYTNNATALSKDILSNKTAYANGEKITGSMPNMGTVNGAISNLSNVFTIPEGYHNGTGTVEIDYIEKNKLIPANIKNNITILGVTGTCEGTNTTDATAKSDEILEEKTAYINKQKITGTMANKGAIDGVIFYASQSYSIPEGYHNGSGNVTIDTAEQAKIIPENIKKGVTALGVTGICEGTNTTDATAQASELLQGSTAYVNKQKITGTMPNLGTANGIISKVSQSFSIQEGYHSGNGKVTIDTAEQAKLIPENIKKNVTILGITGTHESGLDTNDATATANKILEDETAYVKGIKITGTMADRGAINGNISDVSQRYAISKGYHNGEGSVGISEFEQSKIIPANIKKNITILGVTGNHEGGIDTNDATANSAEILSGKTAYINQQKITGSMPNIGAVNGVISSVSGSYTVPEGYHNGEGSISIASSEQTKIIPENIKKGITVLGVTGNAEEQYIPIIRTVNNVGGFTLSIDNYTLQENPVNVIENKNDADGLTFKIDLSNGSILTGLNDFDADTSDATALISEILSGKTAYISDGKVTGSMSNNGAISGKISSLSTAYQIPEGYHNGSGNVEIDSAEQAKIIPANIKKDITILGVTGTYEGISSGNSAISPYISDYAYGYLSGNEWKYYSSNNKHYSDIYTVQANHTYFLTLGKSIGNRFIVCFFTTDVSTTTANVTGTAISDTTNTSSIIFRNVTYTPERNGYIVIYKGNNNLTGIKTYFYDVTEIWL